MHVHISLIFLCISVPVCMHISAFLPLKRTVLVNRQLKHYYVYCFKQINTLKMSFNIYVDKTAAVHIFNISEILSSMYYHQILNDYFDGNKYQS